MRREAALLGWAKLLQVVELAQKHSPGELSGGKGWTEEGSEAKALGLAQSRCEKARSD